MCQARAKLCKCLIIRYIKIIHRVLSVLKPDTDPFSVLKTTINQEKIEISDEKAIGLLKSARK